MAEKDKVFEEFLEHTQAIEVFEEYVRYIHAMQTGVAIDIARGGRSADPKHLRVGINSAMSDQGGLVKLLIAKGVITEEEYRECILESMKREVQDYEDRLGIPRGSLA